MKIKDDNGKRLYIKRMFKEGECSYKHINVGDIIMSDEDNGRSTEVCGPVFWKTKNYFTIKRFDVETGAGQRIPEPPYDGSKGWRVSVNGFYPIYLLSYQKRKKIKLTAEMIRRFYE